MNNIVEFTSADFASQNPQKLASKYANQIVIVKFYTKWCHYCKVTIPDYQSLADTVQKDSRFVVAQVDCDSNPDVMNLLRSNSASKFMCGYKVDGYPTFVIFYNQLFLHKYEKPRRLDNYIEELNKIASDNKIPRAS